MDQLSSVPPWEENVKVLGAGALPPIVVLKFVKEPTFRTISGDSVIVNVTTVVLLVAPAAENVTVHEYGEPAAVSAPVVSDTVTLVAVDEPVNEDVLVAHHD